MAVKYNDCEHTVIVKTEENGTNTIHRKTDSNDNMHL